MMFPYDLLCVVQTLKNNARILNKGNFSQIFVSNLKANLKIIILKLTRNIIYIFEYSEFILIFAL